VRQLALVTWRLPQADLPRLEQARQTLDDVAKRPDVFVLTTCQRALACTLAGDPHEAVDALAEDAGLADGERYAGDEALAHLARVAASLDAMVPGEDQVSSQFRQRLADEEDPLDAALLDRLQRVRAIARQARDAGGLTGHESRSIVDLAAPSIPEGPLGVLGTGTIAGEVADRFDGRPLHAASRSRARAREIADEAAHAWSRAAFLAGPPRLAALVLSTRAPEGPIVDEAAARRLAQTRVGEAPLPIVDLGVPRNAAPAVTGVAGVHLVTVEDLARRARCSPRSDERVNQTRAALQQALQAERRRRRRRRFDERVVALREQLADDLAALAEGTEDLEAEIDSVHGSLAHTAQRHLEAALQGDPPP
jgi:glutamyl-tRNA reductase